MDFQHVIEEVGRYMDFAGVAVMVIGALVSVPLALRGYQPKRARGLAPPSLRTAHTGNCWAGPSCWGGSNSWWPPISSGPSP